MKRNLLLLLVFVFILAGSACKKSNNEDDTNSKPDTNTVVLDTLFGSPLAGNLSLLFSNTYPEFLSTTSIPVQVNIFGVMIFETGTLTYFGEDDNGQSKIQRDGEMTIAPTGKAVDNNGTIYFAVDENTTLVENMKLWVWDGFTWQLYVDETITEQWNGGLAFDYIESITVGAVVDVVTPNGSVIWTLVLQEE
jgi:hypothetical protein